MTSSHSNSDSDSDNVEPLNNSASLKLRMGFNNGEGWHRYEDPPENQPDKQSSELSNPSETTSVQAVSGAEEPSSSVSYDEDQDTNYELTAEEMIHGDFDEDIAEEEDLAEEDELDLLQKDQDVPIEELLKQYLPRSDQAEGDGLHKEGDQQSYINHTSLDGSDEDDGKVKRSSNRLLNVSKLRTMDSDDDDYDGNYNDDNILDIDSDNDISRIRRLGEDFIKDGKNSTVRVGSAYQADNLPEAIKNEHYHDYYENLLWTPDKLSEDEVVKYLASIRKFSFSDYQRKIGSRIHDDEDALNILSKESYKIKQALSAWKSKPKAGQMHDDWSENDCINFENGYLNYPKNFYKINQEFVKNKSVKQIVQFYYIWKKSRRFSDVKSKLQKNKRENVGPGASDYLDRIVSDVEAHFEPTNCGSSFYTHHEALQKHVEDLYRNNLVSTEDGAAYLDVDYENVERPNFTESRNVRLPSGATTGDENIPPKNIKPSNSHVNGS